MIATVYSASLVKNNLYVFLKDINILCVVDVLSKEFNIIGGIPEEPFLAPCLIAKIFVCDDIIYLVPHNAKKAWKYDIKKSSWSVWFEVEDYVIDDRVIEGNGIQQKFNQAYMYDEKIYMIGYRYPSIAIFDLNNKEITYDFGIYGELLKIDNEVDVFIRHDGYLEDDIVLLPCMKKNYVLKYNLITRKGLWIKVGDDNRKYAGITAIGNMYYLAPYCDDKYVIWDGKEHFASEKISCSDNNIYFGAFCVDEQVVFPNYKDYLYYDEVEKGVIIRQGMNGVIDIADGINNMKFEFIIDEEFFGYIDMIDIKSEMNQLELVYENKTLDLFMYLSLLERCR